MVGRTGKSNVPCEGGGIRDMGAESTGGAAQNQKPVLFGWGETAKRFKLTVEGM